MKETAILITSLLIILACDSPSNIELYSPDPSVLSAQADSLIDTIHLSWTRSNEEEDLFDKYILWRSDTPDISSDTTAATRLVVITDQNDTTFTDESLGWDSTYYYALVTVSFLEGGRSWSNEVSATTPQQP